MADKRPQAPQVGLFVTCLVDFFRPGVGFASVELLEKAGCRVTVPEAQTCCGQPAYNSGDLNDTASIARQVIETFAAFDYVVAPSGSCAGQIKKYPELFAADSSWHRRAEDLAARTYEILSFLDEVMHIEPPRTDFAGRVTYHDSCSGLRQLGVKEQPRRLLAGSPALELAELSESETCCGFGGTFCVKYPDISTRMVNDKTDDIISSGAGTVLGGDLGCLMNIAGRLKRRGEPVEVRHTVEVLAGYTDQPAIGEEERG